MSKIGIAIGNGRAFGVSISLLVTLLLVSFYLAYQLGQAK